MIGYPAGAPFLYSIFSFLWPGFIKEICVNAFQDKQKTVYTPDRTHFCKAYICVEHTSVAEENEACVMRQVTFQNCSAAMFVILQTHKICVFFDKVKQPKGWFFLSFFGTTRLFFFSVLLWRVSRKIEFKCLMGPIILFLHSIK